MHPEYEEKLTAQAHVKRKKKGIPVFPSAGLMSRYVVMYSCGSVSNFIHCIAGVPHPLLPITPSCQLSLLLRTMIVLLLFPILLLPPTTSPSPPSVPVCHLQLPLTLFLLVPIGCPMPDLMLPLFVSFLLMSVPAQLRRLPWSRDTNIQLSFVNLCKRLMNESPCNESAPGLLIVVTEE